MTADPSALIADDEPLLRDELARMLRLAWPELRIVAEARNGREAVDAFEALRPDICFLDVHMPGWSGVEAAQRIGAGSRLVFVTAFDAYAVNAFTLGALDYLVKPLEADRLATTVARLQARWDATRSSSTDALLRELVTRLGPERPRPPLRWLRAMVGQTLRMIAVDDIDFLRSDEKYTSIAWRGDDGTHGEALLAMPLKHLLDQLDAAHFVQVHRSVVVNLRAVSHVVRGINETAAIHLRGRDEVLPVSRSYLHLFRQM